MRSDLVGRHRSGNHVPPGRGGPDAPGL